MDRLAMRLAALAVTMAIVLSCSPGRRQVFVAATMADDGQVDGGRAGGGIVKKSLELQESSPVDELIREQPDGEGSMEQLAMGGGLFKMDALDLESMNQMDCHMRNLDLCYAGLLSSLAKPLPETDEDFEMRCDSMKVASICVAKYNDRCQAFRLLSALGPTSGLGSSLPSELRNLQLPEVVEETLLGDTPLPAAGQSAARGPVSLTADDLINLCEPAAKRNATQVLLRKRLFKLAKCINARMPALRPCLEDLKSALQVFYEPGRILPMAPTCCALSRFRDCATRALDNVCGLSSLSQLEASMSQGSASAMAGSIVRTCRKAARFDSDECKELLPPRGIRVPPRSGRRASKLAKVLDMMSFGSTT